jgi:signal transduction histidine kinase
MEPQLSKPSVGDVPREISLEREILEIADREKQRLGRELHDGLCQSLAGLAALASALSRSLSTLAEPGPAEAATEIVRLLNETIGEARDLAHGLGLSGAGLVDALETLARNVSHTHRISCAFAWDGRSLGLDHEAEAHLVRIAQEAVRNATTHGRADVIEISLERVRDEGLLSIQDNGVGLPEDYRHRDGMGLHTMDYRARAIGGRLTVARRPERGTAVACALSLPPTGEPGESPTDVRYPH